MSKRRYRNGRESLPARAAPLTPAEINRRNREFWDKERTRLGAQLRDYPGEVERAAETAAKHAQFARDPKFLRESSFHSEARDRERVREEGNRSRLERVRGAAAEENEERKSAADEQVIAMYRAWERRRESQLAGKESAERVAVHLRTYRPDDSERRKFGVSLCKRTSDGTLDARLPDRYRRRLRALLKAGRLEPEQK